MFTSRFSVNVDQHMTRNGMPLRHYWLQEQRETYWELKGASPIDMACDGHPVLL